MAAARPREPRIKQHGAPPKTGPYAPLLSVCLRALSRRRAFKKRHFPECVASRSFCLRVSGAVAPSAPAEPGSPVTRVDTTSVETSKRKPLQQNEDNRCNRQAVRPAGTRPGGGQRRRPRRTDRRRSRTRPAGSGAGCGSLRCAMAGREATDGDRTMADALASPGLAAARIHWRHDAVVPTSSQPTMHPTPDRLRPCCRPQMPRLTPPAAALRHPIAWILNAAMRAALCFFLADIGERTLRSSRPRERIHGRKQGFHRRARRTLL